MAVEEQNLVEETRGIMRRRRMFEKRGVPSLFPEGERLLLEAV